MMIPEVLWHPFGPSLAAMELLHKAWRDNVGTSTDPDWLAASMRLDHAAGFLAGRVAAYWTPCKPLENVVS